MVTEEEWNKCVQALTPRFKFEYLKELFIEKAKVYGDFMNRVVGAKSHHHNYIGGLKQHTYEMLRSFQALMDTGLYDKLMVDYIAIAVLYHDLAKVYEYKTTPIVGADGKQESVSINYTDYLKLVGHHYGSCHILENDLDKIKKDCPFDQKVLIMHCILAHHGRRDWDAVKEPQTPEAQMVHQLDMLSSQCAKN